MFRQELPSVIGLQGYGLITMVKYKLYNYFSCIRAYMTTFIIVKFNLFFVLFIIITSFSCSKSKDSKTIIKYEVQGASPEGYDAAYSNELGTTSYLRVYSGWTYEVNGQNGKCYTLTIIPHVNCGWSGTINIFFNNSLKVTKSVTTFTESVTNQSGGMSCGITQTACN